MKIAVIQSLRKADCSGASLKSAIFRHFVPKSNRPKDSNSSKIHLIGVDIILQKSPHSINGGMFVTNL